MCNKEWNGRCHRCGQSSITGAHIMSRFNTDLICIGCSRKEKSHPDYRRATDAESAEVTAGNMTFPGIGKPVDL